METVNFLICSMKLGYCAKETICTCQRHRDYGRASFICRSGIGICRREYRNGSRLPPACMYSHGTCALPRPDSGHAVKEHRDIPSAYPDSRLADEACPAHVFHVLYMPTSVWKKKSFSYQHHINCSQDAQFPNFTPKGSTIQLWCWRNYISQHIYATTTYTIWVILVTSFRWKTNPKLLLYLTICIPYISWGPSFSSMALNPKGPKHN